MFEKFEVADIATSGARIRLRHGGKGPPLLLLLVRPCLRTRTEHDGRRGRRLQSLANKLAPPLTPTHRLLSPATPPSTLTSTRPPRATTFRRTTPPQTTSRGPTLEAGG